MNILRRNGLTMLSFWHCTNLADKLAGHCVAGRSCKMAFIAIVDSLLAFILVNLLFKCYKRSLWGETSSPLLLYLLYSHWECQCSYEEVSSIRLVQKCYSSSQRVHWSAAHANCLLNIWASTVTTYEWIILKQQTAQRENSAQFDAHFSIANMP